MATSDGAANGASAPYRFDLRAFFFLAPFFLAAFFLVPFFFGLLSAKAWSKFEAYFGFDPMRVMVTVKIPCAALLKLVNHGVSGWGVLRATHASFGNPSVGNGQEMAVRTGRFFCEVGRSAREPLVTKLAWLVRINS